MTTFNALYYPTWNPPVDFFRAALLFFDRFEVIIPEDVPANYSEANARVVELIPDAFVERRERQYEIDLSEKGWRRFERALDLLVEEHPPTNKVDFLIGPGAEFRIEGYVFTHDAKMNDRIRTLLEERRLLRTELDDYVGALSPSMKGFRVVDERASCLLLSLLADSIARRNRLRTITDEPVGYALNSMNSHDATWQSEVEAHLATAIITSEVPDTIGVLATEQFVDLRNRFEDLRTIFQRAVRDLCNDNMLYTLTDSRSLTESVNEITREYGEGVQRFRSSSFCAGLGSWAPLSVGVLGSALGLAGDLRLGILGAGLGVAVQLYEKFKAVKYEDSIQGSQRLISGLRRDLLAPNVVNRLSVG